MNKYKYPFRVGRSENRAVLDANGKEVIIFKEGDEHLALSFVEVCNNTYGKQEEYKLKIQEAFEVRNEERFWHSLSIKIDKEKKTFVLVGRNLSTNKKFPMIIENNLYYLHFRRL